MLFLDLALGADFGEFTVELRSDQQSETHPVQPRHQCNRGAQGSVSLVEGSEMSEVEAKQIRESDPAANGKNRTRQRGPEALLSIRREEV